MKDSLLSKLTIVAERHEELSALLSDAEVVANQEKFRAFSQEYSDIEPIVKAFQLYTNAQIQRTEAEQLLSDDDPDMRELAAEDVASTKRTINALADDLQKLLIPKDPSDKSNVFLEVRAGTGGDEAAIFAGDLFRMYSRYAESRGWKIEILSERLGDHGGYKEIISRIAGQGVYGNLKFESGAHRVQRVPETESQGRVHTSACTVAVMPEADALEEIEVNKGDLRIDTFRASGAGGQHVNKTDSAIRLTHIPTGIVVECQDERSQHKNKARAMSLLQAKLNDAAKTAADQAQASERRSLVGSGDRSERIRTYNYPQGRITDHRINLTLYKLNEIIAGQLNDVIDPLLQEHQADLLAELSESV